MDAQQAIKHALSDLVKQNKQFTYYDVVKHARSFTDDNVSEADVIAHVSVAMNRKSGYYIDLVGVKEGYLYRSVILYSPSSPSFMVSSQYSPDDIQTDKSLMSKCCGGSSCGSPAISAATKAAKAAANLVKKFQNFQANNTPNVTNCTTKEPSACCDTTVSPAVGLAKGPVQTIGAGFAVGGSSIPSSAFTSSTCCGGSATCDTPASGSVASIKSNIREVIIDNRGRVCIPKAYIDRIGKGAGDVVYVQKSSVKGKLVVSAIQWSAASHTPLTTNQVDCYGNVRITPKSLNKCVVAKFNKNGNQYVTVRSEPDHIVIE